MKRITGIGILFNILLLACSSQLFALQDLSVNSVAEARLLKTAGAEPADTPADYVALQTGDLLAINLYGTPEQRLYFYNASIGHADDGSGWLAPTYVSAGVPYTGNGRWVYFGRTPATYGDVGAAAASHTHTGTYTPYIADPNADVLYGWDNTDNAYRYFNLGTNLSYDHASHTLSATGGSGSGDVIGPATNHANWIPAWNSSANSKTLVDGYVVNTTVGNPGSDSALVTEQAMRETLTAIGAGDTVSPATNTDNYIPQWNGANSKLLKNGLALVTTVGSPGSDSSVPSEQAIRELMAAPGTIGGTTPGEGHFTDLYFNQYIANKSSGVAGDLGLYEANSTDTDTAGYKGPASLTGNTSYRGQFPNARPTSNNMVFAWAGTAGSGSGTPTDPYIHAMSYVDLDNYATLDSPTFTTYTILPHAANPTVDAAGKLAIDTSAGAGGAVRVYTDGNYGLPVYIPGAPITVKDPTATSDYPVMWVPYAITIRAVHYLCIGATSWTGQLQEADSNGANGADTQAADTTAAAGSTTTVTSFSNAGIASGTWLMLKTTSISGTPTSISVSFEYTLDAVN